MNEITTSFSNKQDFFNCMQLSDQYYSSELHLALKELLEKKSKRDGINFTISQLAKAIDMPHSILVKLIHPDPSKRVTNPRIDTLTKIIDFFRTDGFDVTIDWLLGLHSKEVAIQEQMPADRNQLTTIPLYSFDKEPKNLGFINIKLTHGSHTLVAFFSEDDIKPIFKKGSIFIVDVSAKPEHDTLVAVKLEHEEKIIIRKYSVQKSQNTLESFDNKIPTITLLPTLQIQIIGVVIQINAKT